MQLSRLVFSSLMLTCIATAHAAQYGDQLGRCLVEHAGQNDTKILTQWAFVTVGQTQAAREIVTIDKATQNRVSSQAQSVVLRLLGKDCAAEALKATLYEGKNGIPNGIKYAVTFHLTEEMSTQAVDALIAQIANLKTP